MPVLVGTIQTGRKPWSRPSRPMGPPSSKAAQTPWLRRPLGTFVRPGPGGKPCTVHCGPLGGSKK